MLDITLITISTQEKNVWTQQECSTKHASKEAQQARSHKDKQVASHASKHESKQAQE